MTRDSKAHQTDDERKLPDPSEAASMPGPEALSEREAGWLLLQQTLGNRAVGALLRHAGNRLASDTQTQMEARLGHDLSGVEVQTGPEAAETARQLGARAYTAGRRIGFAQDAYAPGTPAGDALLAHELAHVVQNERAGSAPNLRQVTPVTHPSEQQAQAAASGKPAALNAAPAGVALSREADDQDPASGKPLAAAVTGPQTADPALAGAEREEAIGESIDLADTRARTLLNTSYNDVQDAARDFAVTTTGEIDNLPGAPSGHWGVASTLVGLATSVVSARFHNLARLGTEMTRFSTAFAAGQTYVTSAMTEARDEPKTAAKAAMNTVAKAVSYTQAATFSELAGSVYGALVKVARTKPAAAQLLADGSVTSIDEVLTQYLGLPTAGESPYGPVREKMEVAFADWVTMQQRRAEFPFLGSEFGLAERYAEPGRATARARVAAAVAARSGEAPEPEQSVPAQINQGLSRLMLTSVQLAMGDPAAWQGQAMELSAEAEVVAGPLTEEEAAAEREIARGMALADTRAREFLNTHHNEVQDAVRDFVVSAEQQIDELPGAPSAYTALVPTIAGAALGVLGARFPPQAVGKVIATAAASAAVSGVGTVQTTAAGDDHEAKKTEAQQAMQALASGVGNAQAGIYHKARQSLAGELSALAATDPESRAMLQTPNRDALDAVVAGPLGVPHPDDLSLYADVREEMEVPFQVWIQRQRWLLEGLEWLSAYRPDETRAQRKVAAEAALREGAPDQAAEAPPETRYLEIEAEIVTPPAEAPGVNDQQAEAEQARDRLVLRRLVDVDSRARGFLNGHHDAMQDAIRDFSASSNARIDAEESQLGDVLSLVSTMSGFVTTFMFTAFPVVGAVIGGALAVGLQWASSYAADQALSRKANARRAVRRFARESELGLASGFKKARSVLSPLLLSLALTDEDVRAALEIGGQDQIDAVIEVGLGITNPDKAATYEELRKPLEAEFARWLSTAQGLDEIETEAAVASALGEADEDAKLRRGEKPAAAPDKKGKPE